MGGGGGLSSAEQGEDVLWVGNGATSQPAQPSPLRNPFKGWVLLLNSPTGVFPLRHLQCHETYMRFEMKSLFL